MKQYDKNYYDRWYRSPASVITPEFRRQRVRLAVAAAEFVLGRRIRSVLDVGCGEGAWRGDLRRMRPGIHYTGVDSSEYVVQKYGKRRNIRLGGLGTLKRMKFGRAFDLVVCADVLEYVPTAEMRSGLAAMRALMRGVAYIEAYTDQQEFEGDLEGWHQRSYATYRKAFTDAGLHACGLNCWVKRAQLSLLGPFERCT
jgi:SAM-dependent methyltransferase